MDEKKTVKDEMEQNIQNTDVRLDLEEENPGISYEIVIGSTNG